MPTPRSGQQPEEFDENESQSSGEPFWPALRTTVRTQIQELDRQVEELHRERDRLQNFLNDHEDR